MSNANRYFRVCARCSKRRRIDSKLGFAGRPLGARVCNACSKKRTRGKTREQHVMDTYGLTLSEIAELFTRQNFRCAICKGRRPHNLDVDHSHKSGIVRGLLCKRCNRRLLPAALDSIEVLRAAIQYLEVPPATVLWGPRVVPGHGQG